MKIKCNARHLFLHVLDELCLSGLSQRLCLPLTALLQTGFIFLRFWTDVTEVLVRLMPVGLFIISVWQLLTSAVSWSSLHIYCNTDFPPAPVLSSSWKTPWTETARVLESAVGYRWLWPPTSLGTNMTFVPWPPPSFPRHTSMSVRAEPSFK